jgi:hypothetical protein
MGCQPHDREFVEVDFASDRNHHALSAPVKGTASAKDSHISNKELREENEALKQNSTNLLRLVEEKSRQCEDLQRKMNHQKPPISRRHDEEDESVVEINNVDDILNRHLNMQLLGIILDV